MAGVGVISQPFIPQGSQDGLSGKLSWQDYPQPHIDDSVQDLSEAVLRRVGITNQTTKCLVFPSATAVQQCAAALDVPSSRIVRFVMPPESNLTDKASHWANFSAIILPSEKWQQALAFWCDTEAGLSARDSGSCLEEFDYMDCDSLDPELRFSAPLKRNRLLSPRSVA